ncbi:MAG: hypothetical protein JO317_06600, partial [Verrucomicrobiae bacterium]|nr:hypothetical protein [Verrucomicrobiae bacterium]
MKFRGRKPQEEMRVSDWLTPEPDAPVAPRPAPQDEENRPDASDDTPELQISESPAASVSPAPSTSTPSERPDSKTKNDVPPHTNGKHNPNIVSRPAKKPFSQTSLTPITPPNAAKSAPPDPSVLLDGFSAGLRGKGRRGGPAPVTTMTGSDPVALTAAGSMPPAGLDDAASQQLPFDPLRIVGGILQRKRWIVTWALAGLIAGFALGYMRGDTYEASMVLMFRDVPQSVGLDATGRSYKPKEIDPATLTAMLKDNQLLQRVGAQMNPPMSRKNLINHLVLDNDRAGNYAKLVYKGAPTAEAAVAAVNMWGQEAINYTKVQESHDTHETRVYLEKQGVQDAINAAKTELSRLRSQYSDQNPLVREKLSQIQQLEEQMQQGQTEAAVPAKSETPQNVLGYFSVMSPATVEAAKSKTKWFKGAVAGGAGFAAAFFISLVGSFLMEAFDSSLRTTSELERTIGSHGVQKIPRIRRSSITSPEVSSLWTRVVGASPREVVAFWAPHPHHQADLVMQSLLHLASRHDVPMLWVDTGAYHIQFPQDFREVTPAQLQRTLEPGRYFVRMDLSACSATDADQAGSALADTAARQRMPVWIGMHGQIVEPACSVARHAHRVKFLAALSGASREFWETQAELLKQSIPTPF